VFVRRLLALAVALALGGVPGTAGRASPSDAPASVTIAYQPGIGYANLIVMKQTGALERRFPGTTFEWRVLASGATIRDGMIAGQIQIGAGGVPPFLIGWDRGIGYRLIGSLNEMNLWLVSRAPNVKKLKDLPASAKIGVPAPDSIQAIALRKGAQDQLGNAHAFDTGFVAIEHPLGVAALLNGQLDAHLSAPPFEQEEVEAGGHVIFKSYDVFGSSTFNSVFATDAFASDHPRFIATFYRELQAATGIVNKDPARTASLLSKESDGKVPAATFRKWLAAPDITFTTIPHGLLKYARFMKDIGFLSKAPASIREIELSTLSGAGD
jgi:NitT/TauT family transport system substrate-binding protein